MQARVPSSAFDLPIVRAIPSLPLVFNGFGLKSACDVLCDAGIWPWMPVWALCASRPSASSSAVRKREDGVDVDIELFDRFTGALRKYACQWTSNTFLAFCAIDSNSNNPIFHNPNAVKTFQGAYVRIYQKRKVIMRKELYDEYGRRGLLDMNHVIGASNPLLRSRLFMLIVLKGSRMIRIPGSRQRI